MVSSGSQYSLEKIKEALAPIIYVSRHEGIVDSLGQDPEVFKIVLGLMTEALEMDLGKEDDFYKCIHLDFLHKLIEYHGSGCIQYLNQQNFIDAVENCFKRSPKQQEKAQKLMTLVIKLGDTTSKLDTQGRTNQFGNNEAQQPVANGIMSSPNDFATKTQSDIRFDNKTSYCSQIIHEITTSTKHDDTLFTSGTLSSQSAIFQSKQTAFQKESPTKLDNKLEHPGRNVLSLPPHHRTSFYYGETLAGEESLTVEYKNYYYPFNESLMRAVQKNICSFLNRIGGRMYIGVEDVYKRVDGVHLPHDARDKLRLDIFSFLSAFYPPISHEDRVGVKFVPLRDWFTDELIPEYFVVKIIVKPGNPRYLYSITRKGLQCFLRQDGFVKELEADQITQLILKRHSLSEIAQVDHSEFDDPEPEAPAPEHNFEPGNNNTVAVPQIYGYEVQGIHPKVTDSEFNKLFDEAGVDVHSINLVRHPETKECLGNAVVNFYSSETGQKITQKINQMSIKGKRLLMKSLVFDNVAGSNLQSEQKFEPKNDSKPQEPSKIQSPNQKPLKLKKEKKEKKEVVVIVKKENTAEKAIKPENDQKEEQKNEAQRDSLAHQQRNQESCLQPDQKSVLQPDEKNELLPDEQSDLQHNPQNDQQSAQKPDLNGAQQIGKQQIQQFDQHRHNQDHDQQLQNLILLDQEPINDKQNLMNFEQVNGMSIIPETKNEDLAESLI